jgi:hypothetical protein
MVSLYPTRRWLTWLTHRRIGFFSPPIMTVALTTSFVIFLVPRTTVAADDLSNTIRTLLQVASVIFGMNILGLTINVNQFGQAASIRALLVRMSELTGPLYDTFYNAHPRDQKLQRPSFVRSLVDSISIKTLQFENENGQYAYFTTRPNWDGIWYQLVYSPFSEHKPEWEKGAIAALHEAAIIAIRLLAQIHEMRSSGCCLLSKSRGSNGTRWFLGSFETIDKGLFNERPPAKLSSITAALYINLCFNSGHYLQEEIREQLQEPNWEPAKVTHFACYFIRQTIWMGYLWQKVQVLRLARIKRRISGDKLLAQTSSRTGINQISEAKMQLLNLAQTAAAEFGVSSRFWAVRQAAIPGMGWTMLFLSITAVVWPIATSLGTAIVAAGVFAFAYGIGLVALLESLVFASVLIWGRRSQEPFKSYAALPPP